MKSGNNFRIRFVKNWEIEVRGNEVVSLMVERVKFFDWIGHPKLIVKSINLSQIEAITYV